MTDQYAVFGNPIAHSKSPRIHALFAKQTNEHIQYCKKRVPKGLFNERAKCFFANPNNKGLNITVPFKMDAYNFADKLTKRAELAGAVNTLKKLRNGKILGDNTDGAGLVRDITHNLGWEIKGKNILILGAGGAVRGVLKPLLDENPKEITIANRTLSKSTELKNLFQKSGNISVWNISEDIPNKNFDLIINSTSITLDGDAKDLSNLIMAVNVSNTVCAYDMVYGKPSPFAQMSINDPKPNVNTPLHFKLVENSTPFQANAEFRGIPNTDGLGMLVEQAAESFYIWRGVRPETKSVIAKVRSEL